MGERQGQLQSVLGKRARGEHDETLLRRDSSTKQPLLSVAVSNSDYYCIPPPSLSVEQPLPPQPPPSFHPLTGRPLPTPEPLSPIHSPNKR